MEHDESQNQNQQTTSTENQDQGTQTSTVQDGSQSTENHNQVVPPVQNANQDDLNNARESNQDIIRLYDQVLREQQQELARLRQEREERNKPAPLSADEQKQRFFSNPMDVLREEISNAVKPLMDFTQTFKQQSEYDKLKDKYRNDPRYSQLFPHIESYVDQILANSEKNEQTLRTAVLVAIGAAQTGEIKIPVGNNGGRQTAPQNTPPNNNNQNPNNMTVPAHLRSTPPAVPVNNNNNQKPVLTELEKRLARERGMSEDEWARFRDMPSHEVANAEVK